MSDADALPDKKSLSSWRRIFWGLVAAIAGILLVTVQGLTVGLFGGYHGSLHWGSFLLHVVVLGPLPVIFVFWLATVFPVPEPFVIDLAIAMIATSLFLVGSQLLGGLNSSNLTLIKFAVAAYGSYTAVAYLWAYRTMRASGKSGLDGWVHVYEQVFRMTWSRLGATQQPEMVASDGSGVIQDSAFQSESREQPQTAVKPCAHL